MAGNDATNIESLSLKISTDSEGASKGIKSLAASLATLKDAVNIDSASVSALKGVSDAVQGLAGLNNIKLSASVPKQLNAIGEAVRGLYGIQTSDITDLTVTLKALGEVGSISLGPIIGQLSKLPEAAEGLKNIDAAGFKEKLAGISEALAPLSNLGKNNLTSYITQLGKLPDIVKQLDDEKLNDFAAKVQKIAEALKPLGDEMVKVTGGFTQMANGIQQVSRQSISLTSRNTGMIQSFTDVYNVIRSVYRVITTVSDTLGKFITKQNEYIENVNLFNVSMGQYAVSAHDYAETVREVMGIDPSEWIRNQGIFMTLSTGFGVASDRAALMSKQLTQLGYDLSSFFNDSFENAMLKLQSGLAGELEPLRRWGFDLSQAKLQQTALNLGIEKSIQDMTQAEKAQLRYYAIMTQVTTAHGDMARTLSNPANSLRILASEASQAARAIGGIFIPMLQKILPYAIAVAKVVKIAADIIGQIAGYEAPDFGGFELAESTTGGMADNIEDATSSAKELKRTLLGIDEINKLNDNTDTGSGLSDSVTDGFSFELPTYDFLDGATQGKIDEIVEKMKEWLGLTDDIDSWADLLNTRLGAILTTAGAIGAALLLWKLSQTFIDTIKWLLTSLSGNLTLSIAGFTIEALGAYSWGKDGANLQNVLQTVIGGAVGAAGLALMGLAIGGAAGGLIGLTLGLALAIAIGSIAFQKGREAKWKEDFWNSEAGKELLKIKEEIEESWDIVKEIRVKIKTTMEEYQQEEQKWAKIKELVQETFDLSEIVNKTPEQIQTIKNNIETLNNLNIDGLKFGFDEATGSVTAMKDGVEKSREAVEDLIETQRRLALETAAQDALKETYEELFNLMAEKQKLLKNDEESFKIYDTEREKLDALKEKLAEVNEKWAEQAQSGEVGRNAAQEYANATQELNDKIAEQEIRVKEAANANFEAKQALAETRAAAQEACDAVDYYDRALAELSGNELPEATSASETFRKDLGLIPDATEEAKSGVKSMVDSAKQELQTLPQSAQQAADGIRQAFKTLPDEVARTKEELALLADSNFNFLNGGTSTTSMRGFASGGVPEKGEMFIAREQGPELVGKIGNSTAVMNNGQIVQSVAVGVKDANAEQNSLLREQNGLLRKLLEKDSSVTAIISTQDIQRGLERQNRRVGKTVVPVG